MEAGDKLESKATELTSDIKQINKDLSGAQKTIVSVGNKGDELKKTMASLQKRIEKLEAKK